MGVAMTVGPEVYMRAQETGLPLPYCVTGHSEVPLGNECQGCVACCYLGFCYNEKNNRDYKPNGIPCKYIGENGDGSGFGCSIYARKMHVCNVFRCYHKRQAEIKEGKSCSKVRCS
ncbi:hypothetical protein LCGC14_0895040 [marine sediment metagenome]|uniref:Uncharacterized protein n=1 Tax=marine sediment metagenome TaxID=412755 RepID=A0A0F9P2Y6_9ZZZZ